MEYTSFHKKKVAIGILRQIDFDKVTEKMVLSTYPFHSLE